MLPFIAPAIAAISGLLASIGPALASLGPTLSMFSAKFLPTLLPSISAGIQVMEKIGQVAEVVLNFAGILKPGETIGEMGSRALQASKQDITLDQYDSVQDYMQALRGIRYNPEQYRDQPMIPLVAGLLICGYALEDKFDQPQGSSSDLWQLVGSDPDYFNAERLKSYLKSGQNIADIVDYYRGKLGGAESLDVENDLIKIEQNTQPSLDSNSLRQAMYAQQDKVQGKSAMVED